MSEKVTEKDDSSSPARDEHAEKTVEKEDVYDVGSPPPSKPSTVFQNPLADVPREKLFEDVETFCKKFNLTDHLEIFKKGALISQNPAGALDLLDLTEEDRIVIRREHTHKWSQPWALYSMAAMCSLAAAVQGMDETANNGAQALYLKVCPQQFSTLRKQMFPRTQSLTILQRLNIVSYEEGGRFSQAMTDNLTGLVVGAPYLACAIVGCWLTEPLNALTARRGTIFISCVIAALASVWEGLANSWVNLFLARFVLGLGIGSKSSTVPVYAAECSPAPIRGSLVMMWQMFV